MLSSGARLNAPEAPPSPAYAGLGTIFGELRKLKEQLACLQNSLKDLEGWKEAVFERGPGGVSPPSQGFLKQTIQRESESLIRMISELEGRIGVVAERQRADLEQALHRLTIRIERITQRLDKLSRDGEDRHAAQSSETVKSMQTLDSRIRALETSQGALRRSFSQLTFGGGSASGSGEGLGGRAATRQLVKGVPSSSAQEGTVAHGAQREGATTPAPAPAAAAAGAAPALVVAAEEVSSADAIATLERKVNEVDERVQHRVMPLIQELYNRLVALESDRSKEMREPSQLQHRFNEEIARLRDEMDAERERNAEQINRLTQQMEAMQLSLLQQGIHVDIPAEQQPSEEAPSSTAMAGQPPTAMARPPSATAVPTVAAAARPCGDLEGRVRELVQEYLDNLQQKEETMLQEGEGIVEGVPGEGEGAFPSQEGGAVGHPHEAEPVMPSRVPDESAAAVPSRDGRPVPRAEGAPGAASTPSAPPVGAAGAAPSGRPGGARRWRATMPRQQIVELRSAVDSLADQLSSVRVAEKVEASWGNELAGRLEGLSTAVRDTLETVRMSQHYQTDSHQKIRETVEAFHANLQPYFAQQQDLATQIDEHSQQRAELAESFGRMEDAIETAASTVDGLEGRIDSQQVAIESIVEEVESSGSAFQHTASQMSEQLTARVSAVEAKVDQAHEQTSQTLAVVQEDLQLREEALRHDLETKMTAELESLHVSIDRDRERHIEVGNALDKSREETGQLKEQLTGLQQSFDSEAGELRSCFARMQQTVSDTFKSKIEENGRLVGRQVEAIQATTERRVTAETEAMERKVRDGVRAEADQQQQAVSQAIERLDARVEETVRGRFAIDQSLKKFQRAHSDELQRTIQRIESIEQGQEQTKRGLTRALSMPTEKVMEAHEELRGEVQRVAQLVRKSTQEADERVGKVAQDVMGHDRECAELSAKLEQLERQVREAIMGQPQMKAVSAKAAAGEKALQVVETLQKQYKGMGAEMDKVRELQRSVKLHDAQLAALEKIETEGTPGEKEIATKVEHLEGEIRNQRRASEAQVDELKAQLTLETKNIKASHEKVMTHLREGENWMATLKGHIDDTHSRVRSVESAHLPTITQRLDRQQTSSEEVASQHDELRETVRRLSDQVEELSKRPAGPSDANDSLTRRPAEARHTHQPKTAKASQRRALEASPRPTGSPPTAPIGRSVSGRGPSGLPEALQRVASLEEFRHQTHKDVQNVSRHVEQLRDKLEARTNRLQEEQRRLGDKLVRQDGALRAMEQRVDDAMQTHEGSARHNFTRLSGIIRTLVASCESNAEQTESVRRRVEELDMTVDQSVSLVKERVQHAERSVSEQGGCYKQEIHQMAAGMGQTRADVELLKARNQELLQSIDQLRGDVNHIGEHLARTVTSDTRPRHTFTRHVPLVEDVCTSRTSRLNTIEEASFATPRCASTVPPCVRNALATMPPCPNASSPSMPPLLTARTHRPESMPPGSGSLTHRARGGTGEGATVLRPPRLGRK
ncbi:unnamed protein product [Vitrella brassicaformis CCMP3155]|uniref:Uncharacterized protein n=4 Tax=Vitrella brassicaformis TaxID=1169539 RepID=A0A0G4GJL2_VITBC|nr:unnamed protein product [Vitrella brassicaformis CCMP3155]|eukprot:CEM30132.1 unnamed protein product [Vitrella brassicaformis CCMP3155]